MEKKEDAEVEPSSVIDQAFLPIIDSAGVSASAAAPAPASSLARAASQDKEKDKEALKDLSGFIFLCSGLTKLDCFRFHVFGLRANKKEIVEKIKPGTKLFLFDFELKLLYGVYEATSTGKLDMESHAFGGKFPSQVKFQIYKECLPLQESSFRHAIKDNYHGRKFEPELNGHQVRNVLSLFCPLTASATTVSHPRTPSLANVDVPSIMSSLGVEDQVKMLPYPQEDVLSGFIFLCGGSTKHDCYRFRVFGLPSYKKERVEKIKPGTKLFLFDVELKLLYGVYEATSTGIIDVEPLAFGGKFPAQVKFQIFKECLPLPEPSFRHTIKDNYRGNKFEPELNDRQVRNLLSLFRPLAASATAAVPPHPLAEGNQFFANNYMPKITPALAKEDRIKVLSCPQEKAGSFANFPPPNTTPALYTEHQVKYSSRPTYVEDPYMIGMQHVHPPPLESQRVYELQSAQHGWARTTNFVDTAHTVAERKQLTAPSHAYSCQPCVTQGISTDIQDPYLSYRPMQDGVPWQPHLMEQTDRNYQFYSGVERGMLPPQENIVTHNYSSGPSAPYVPPVQQQYASEAVMQQGTSSMSFERSLIRRFG
ncbi:hypothetical protein P3S68_013569 [Capsicum galapagoense]